ncbi:unnamed protein product, partial [Ectocarpus sp. 12 AP-2014]
MPPAATCGRQQQQSLRAGPLLVVALVAVNLSTAPLLVTAKFLPRSRWVAASSNGGSLHDSSASSNARAVAVGARCGATSSGKEDEGEDTDEPPSSSVSESSLAATVKEIISKLTGVVESLLGGEGSKSGGAAGGGTKAKKSSKRKSNSSRGGFTEAFEAKYGKRHPKCNEKSFGYATETAWGRNRLCLVYIAAEKGSGGKAAKVDDAICKALADPE